MKTRLTEMFDIEHPIMLAGMGGVSYHALVAAVSEAGGIGTLGASTMGAGVLAEEIAGVKLQRNYKLDAPKGVRGRNSDNTKIQALLGWQPSIPLAEGMRKTYEWVFDQVASKKVG